MFTNKNLRIWELKDQIKKENIKNPFCVFNPNTGCYYLVFEFYYEVFIPGEMMNYSSGEWVQSFLGNNWPLIGITNPKQFKSYNHCNHFSKNLGLTVADLPLKQQTTSRLIDYFDLTIHREFKDITSKPF